MLTRSLKEQIIARIRPLVINQSRYTLASDIFPDIGDDMSDEENEKFLLGRSILAPTELLQLADGMTLESLFGDDGWVDPIADYIIYHKDDCAELITRLTELSHKYR